jgi:EAL domain-containing protein (putative c-di-GMP-specific phosphodiesterase class I)
MMTLKILLLASAGFILLRFLLLRRWSRSQCPRCGHSFLIRTKRGLRDHIFASFFVAPLRRYQCQFYSCNWRGLAHYSQRKYSKKIKIESISKHKDTKHTIENTELEHIKTEHKEIQPIPIKSSETESNSLEYIPNQSQTEAKGLKSTKAKNTEIKSLQSSSLNLQKSLPLTDPPLSFIIPETENSDLFTSEVSLYRQLENNEFIVKYQPIINIKNSNIIGMEALLHWEHPERGFIPPRDFIPLADKNTLILPIGKWALTQACLQAKAWQNRNIQPLFISVNISPRHFYLPNLIQIITESLKQNDLDPRSLELDVSVSTLKKDLNLAKRILIELRAQGINVCLDDFDIDSFLPEYLGQPLFSTIKTHLSLMQNLGSQLKAYEGMESILSLSLELGFNVVAKGVETREQLGILRSLGCEIVQGYLFDLPLTPEDATDVLRANWLGRSSESLKSSTAPVASA